MLLWLLLAGFTALVIRLASPFFGLGFQWGLFALLSAVLAALFLAPAVKGWGLRQNSMVFARIGVAALVVYLGVCTVALLMLLWVRRTASLPLEALRVRVTG